MSFTPAPIIPQTPDQAVQRDQAHGHQPLTQTPEAQLAVLRNAIRHHQAAMEAAGPLGVEADFTPEQVQTMAVKHEADRTLWAHLET